MSVVVYVFGHYDSRGGTVAVQADSKDEAVHRYCAFAGWPEGEVLAAEDDYLGCATLEGPLPDAATDLEYEAGGRVLIDGDGQDGELPGSVEGATLTYRPDLTPEHRGPRWDDDAFSFYYLPKITNPKD